MNAFHNCNNQEFKSTVKAVQLGFLTNSTHITTAHMSIDYTSLSTYVTTGFIICLFVYFFMVVFLSRRLYAGYPARGTDISCVYLISLYAARKWSEVYALCMSPNQCTPHENNILHNLILCWTGKCCPNCFPLEQRDYVLRRLADNVANAPAEDKQWLVSVLNNCVEIPDFKATAVFLLGLVLSNLYWDHEKRQRSH